MKIHRTFGRALPALLAAAMAGVAGGALAQSPPAGQTAPQTGTQSDTRDLLGRARSTNEGQMVEDLIKRLQGPGQGGAPAQAAPPPADGRPDADLARRSGNTRHRGAFSRCDAASRSAAVRRRDRRTPDMPHARSAGSAPPLRPAPGSVRRPHARGGRAPARRSAHPTGATATTAASRRAADGRSSGCAFGTGSDRCRARDRRAAAGATAGQYRRADADSHRTAARLPLPASGVRRHVVRRPSLSELRRHPRRRACPASFR